ncbi:MAG: DUF4397 domain-containing protein [Ignavibacteriae bacterium]|nr:DUF4397 domain-containing protein [Ignavibacteriota bacterium]MCB9215735.1 DUF4397 domain-containing protein [Ignavibacteria bacterium]
MTQRNYALLLFALLLTGSFIVSGCGEDSVEPTPAKPRLLFLHAAPITADKGVDILIGNEEVVQNKKFGEFATYVDVPSGSQDVKVVETGTTSAAFTTNLIFNEEKNYSLIAYNETDGTVGALLFRDDLSAPASGQALVRVVHLINDGPKVRVAFKGTGDPLYDSIAFKQVTEFFNPRPAGTYTLRIMDVKEQGGGSQSGGANALIEQEVTLQAGKIYTFAAIGTAASPELVVISNN